MFTNDDCWLIALDNICPVSQLRESEGVICGLVSSNVLALLPVGNLSYHVQIRSVIVILTGFFQDMLDLLLSDILVDGSSRSRFVSEDLLNGFQMLSLIMK